MLEDTKSSIYIKRFVSRQRFELELQGRKFLPPDATAEILTCGDLEIKMRRLLLPGILRSRLEILNFLDFIYECHTFFIDKIQKFNWEYMPTHLRTCRDFEVVNNRIALNLGVPDYTPVKIGDLKPEHVFKHGSTGFKIIDVETLGLGYLLEDIVWTFRFISRSSFLFWKQAHIRYCRARFGSDLTISQINNAIRQCYLSMCRWCPELRLYKWYF